MPKRFPHLVASITTVFCLGACQSAVVQEFPLTKLKAESTLDRGIREYDDGDYRLAARTIQSAIDLGLTSRSQGRAHKYLAFMHCAASRAAECRGEFQLALTADPRLTLKAEESGHPAWGPVFDRVKSERPKQ